MKKSGVLNLTLAMLLSASGVAQATCFAEGKVVRLRTNSGQTTGVVDIATPLVAHPVTFHTFVVNTETHFSLLGDAISGNLTVGVTGNATFCATSGTFRSGGTVLSVDLFKNR